MTVRREIAESLAGWKTTGMVSVGPASCVTEPSPPAFLLFGYVYGSDGCTVALGAVVAAAAAAGAVSFATAG